MNTEKSTDPDEADAEALSSFIANHFPRVVSSLGGATSFASAISEIGLHDDDDFDDDSNAVVGETVTIMVRIMKETNMESI
jgi:hypothetical protein